MARARTSKSSPKSKAKTKAAPRKKPRATAETMAAGQREISVSEFFAKNRHLLGFDNPRKALLTTVKEAVDNALDACEEGEILPDLIIQIEEITPPPGASKPGRYRVTITDNGPGIVRAQVDNIFGKLLYGSKFHRMKMSRGQQGIGISAAGMYGLMTTGKPMVIHTKPNKRKAAHHIELAMDTTKNKPEVTVDIETDDFPVTSSGTGTRVSIELEARYTKGKTSVDTYLEQTAIANPHAKITFIPPEKSFTTENAEDADGGQGSLIPDPEEQTSPSVNSVPSVVHKETEAIVRTTDLVDRIVFPRTVGELPPETVEIKPHPYGVELGMFLRMLKSSHEKQLGGFFRREFCRVTPTVVKEVTKAASVNGKTITGQSWVKNIDHADAEKIYTALQSARLRNPPTDCLAPIGVRQMLAGMLKGVRAEFYSAATRSPAVYRGNPFQIEAAIAFGGDLPGDQPARIIRFANRVPLLYQQSACCSFKSVIDTSWKGYGLSQPRGSLPVGPLVVMIHMASVWVPFTSESKEAIADYDEIRKEMRLALQECGRKLGTYIRRRQKMRREGQRRDVFERYIGEISKSCEALVGSDAAEVYDALLRQAKRKTEIADARLDEDGKIIKPDDGNGRLDNDDGVVIIDPSGDGPTAGLISPTAGDEPPAQAGGQRKPKKSKPRAPARGSGSKPKARTTKKKTKRPRMNADGSRIKNKGKPKPKVRLGQSESNLFVQ